MTYPAGNPGEPQATHPYTYPDAPPGHAPAAAYQPGAAPVPGYPAEQVTGGYAVGDYPQAYTVESPGVTRQAPAVPQQYMPPTSGGPISGPPVVSGPGYPPMSGPPMSGPPMSGPPMSGPPAARRAPWVPILAGATALFLISTILMSALFLSRNGDYNAAKRTVAARDDTIASRDSELDRTKKDLQTARTDLEAAQRQLRGVSNDNEQNKRDKETVSRCLTLLIEALEASNAGDRTKVQNKINEMKQPCDEAERIIG